MTTLIQREPVVVVGDSGVTSGINNNSNNHNNHKRRKSTGTSSSTTTTTGCSSSSSISEHDYIRQGCSMNCRIDGRAVDEFRHYTIRTAATNEAAVSQPSFRNIKRCSTGSSSSSSSRNDGMLLLLNTQSCHGYSQLYDTVTNGTNLHLTCHIKAELVDVVMTSPTTTQTQQNTNNTTNTTTTTNTSKHSSGSSSSTGTSKNSDIPVEWLPPLFEISLLSSDNNNNAILKEYETSLQQYYIPCLIDCIQQQQKQNRTRVITTTEGRVDDSNNNNTAMVQWKFYIDVQILSSMVVVISAATTTTTSTTNSVYYLDNVTHVINAALLHTTVPAIIVVTSGSPTIPIQPKSVSRHDSNSNPNNPNKISNSRTTNSIPYTFDSDTRHSKPLIAIRPPTTTTVSSNDCILPFITTTHVVVADDGDRDRGLGVGANGDNRNDKNRTNSNHTNTKTKKKYVLIADATNEEANLISNVAIHVVVVPSSSIHNGNFNIGGVWKTKSGSIPFHIFQQHSCMTSTTLQVLASKAYQCFHC